MTLNALTIFHVVLSLVGIGSGAVAIYGLLKAKTPGRWTLAFLATTAATSLTGFLFPFHGVTPAQVLGVLSLIALIPRVFRSIDTIRRGSGAGLYAIAAVMALLFATFSCWSSRFSAGFRH